MLLRFGWAGADRWEVGGYIGLFPSAAKGPILPGDMGDGDKELILFAGPDFLSAFLEGGGPFDVVDSRKEATMAASADARGRWFELLGACDCGLERSFETALAEVEAGLLVLFDSFSGSSFASSLTVDLDVVDPLRVCFLVRLCVFG